MNSTIERITSAELDHVIQWSRLLEVLARDADALVEPVPGADQQAYRTRWNGIADRWFSLLWPSVTPAFIAESARRARGEMRPVPLLLGQELTDEEKLAALDALPQAAPAPEPAPEPEPLTVENVSPASEADPAPLARADDPEPVWLTSDQLSAELGISRSLVHKLARTGVLGMDLRQKRGKAWWFEKDKAIAAFHGRVMTRKPCVRPAPAPAAGPDPTPAEPAGPADPPADPAAAADAAALLELAGGDPATLAALRALLVERLTDCLTGS